MRVGIDARVMGMQMGGGDTCTRNLVRTLASVDPDTEYMLFLTPRQATLDLPGTEHMRRAVVGPENLQVRIPFTLPYAAARAGIDVLHAHFLAPPLNRARNVVTIHDISFERYPRFFTKSFVAQYRAIMPLVVRQAAMVLTGSEYSRQHMVRRYRVDPAKVVVAPYAADPIFKRLRDDSHVQAIRARYRTGDRFVLCVGEIQPRKNLKTLIEAYVRLRRAGATRHRLVLVGKSAWLYDDTFAAARASGYQDELVFTGYVPDEDLVALYNAADLFVYPSLFEGFGLPPLEAMACGTPVVASNTSSLPEVVGDAGLLVDPLDVEALAAAMADALANTALQHTLTERGIQRAATFSWERTARIVAAVYRAVYQGRQARPAAPATRGGSWQKAM
jgi:glycosyltransferase involved in cell wall biosynthesis